MLEIIKKPLPGLLVIKPRIFKDERGFFLETWQRKRYKDIGIKEDFVQDNWSRSTRGVLRGLHFQKEHPQGKLVSVRSGKVFDVAVDIRKESPTFGQWHAEELSESNHLQMYIPPGFAHGFCVLSEVADFNYKCTDYYYPDDEEGLHYRCKDLKIKWPDLNKYIVSDKDEKNKRFSSLFN
ncbi:dTDP-4-dehydrorhamnose 3,5-epimerase [Gracilimonas sediminicola]|uniref:dTDP-4-dehydrorhamnose 3,5-epimerase n=1 Tax=Gracilimonas sediminicola TaxID=2952158 RepID=A0A9X2L4M0_9BACT|nr:dTDP-4-dehydrorhamnose 3,5-epimerase [Gracilimonas sediminicola]MCP9292296.1 dTDP-4-dehydrorhamnose 3,5-epimerase [Gracilimonas sediminicola]